MLRVEPARRFAPPAKTEHSSEWAWLRGVFLIRMEADGVALFRTDDGKYQLFARAECLADAKADTKHSLLQLCLYVFAHAYLYGLTDAAQWEDLGRGGYEVLTNSWPDQYAVRVMRKNGKYYYPEPCWASGYQRVLINGLSQSLHSLVTEAMTKMRPKGKTADHINRNCIDNSAGNLCWSTASEQNFNRTSAPRPGACKRLRLFRDNGDTPVDEFPSLQAAADQAAVIVGHPVSTSSLHNTLDRVKTPHGATAAHFVIEYVTDTRPECAVMQISKTCSMAVTGTLLVTKTWLESERKCAQVVDYLRVAVDRAVLAQTLTPAMLDLAVPPGRTGIVKVGVARLMCMWQKPEAILALLAAGKKWDVIHRVPGSNAAADLEVVARGTKRQRVDAEVSEEPE